MKETAFYILLIIAFLSSAKTHGRQHRLERELQGHWTVSFTSRSQNHPWVERFWFRQRLVYWSLASITAGLLLAGRFRSNGSRWKLYAVKNYGKWAWTLFLIMTVLSSMIVAFAATGLLSAMRIALKLNKIPSPGADWLQGAIWGSLGWWLLTTFLVLLPILAVRRWFVSKP